MSRVPALVDSEISDGAVAADILFRDQPDDEEDEDNDEDDEEDDDDDEGNSDGYSE